MRTIETVVLALAISGAGCVSEPEGAEADGEDVELSESEQAFTSNWNYSWGDTKFSRADIGTAVGRACFMSGVAGRLTVNKFPEGDSQAGAGVRIDPATNRWYIYVDPSFSVALQTWARCVNSTSMTAEVTWRSGQPKKIIAPVAAGRRCFFTNLTTGRDNEFDHGGFQGPIDSAWINNDGTNWYIHGIQSGLAWASARCITVSADLGQFSHFAPNGSTDLTPLVSSTNGSTCLLTEVVGPLTANDWTKGPFVSHNDGHSFFDLNTKDGTGGSARCVR